MSKLYLAFFLLLAVLPVLNAQTKSADQPFITSCVAAFKSAQASAIKLSDVLNTGDKTQIVKALKTMAPEIQELALQCNLKPFLSPIRSIATPDNCVQNIEQLKNLVERIKSIDTSKASITIYVLVVSTYGTLIGKIPKLLSDCAPSN